MNDHQPIKIETTEAKTKQLLDTYGDVFDAIIEILEQVNYQRRLPVLEAMMTIIAPKGCLVKFEYSRRLKGDDWLEWDDRLEEDEEKSI